MQMSNAPQQRGLEAKNKTLPCQNIKNKHNTSNYEQYNGSFTEVEKNSLLQIFQQCLKASKFSIGR